MQNKGLVKFLAVALTLVSLFYLSFTFVTNKYYKQAKEHSGGDPVLESQYLDNLSNEKVWLGYTLKKCRSMEINLGLDLKGGMNVIMEIRSADVLKSLSDYNPDPIFNQALANATEIQAKSQNDFISIFAEQYKQLDPNARLSAIFGTYELREKITPQSTNEQVIAVLREDMKSAFDNSFNVLRTRIDRFGVVAPNIQQLDRDGRILIELPGVKEPERVRTLLQGTANLEFWETYMGSEIQQTLYAANNIIRDSIQSTISVESEMIAETTDESAVVDVTSDLLVDSLGNPIVSEETAVETVTTGIDEKMFPLFNILGIYPNQSSQSPIVASVRKADMYKVDQFLNNSKVKALFETNRLSLKWTVKPVDEKEDIYQLIALKVNYIEGKTKPILTGDVITDARDDFGQHSSTSEVSMSMNTEGAKIWARLTRENVGKSIAIVLDNNVYSFPTVQNEIQGGRSQITGNFTPEEAKDLANVLKSGKMSAPAHIIQEDVIGPSLGQEAIQKGIIAFIWAFVVLMAYLIFMYGFRAGMVANGALLFNLFFTLGVMASFHAVLTLSGIAGIVLSLAMAVDANVLIYERIKEEMRGGKQIKKALEAGYTKAFSAIFDSNFTSILTGGILWYFGTGPIRGFATTLIIGIAISFFTAVYLTRWFYESSMAKGKLLNMTFTTSLMKNFLVNPNFNFFKYKKGLYMFTVGVVIACAVSLGTRGLSQGIDFTGGRNYIVRFDQDINTVEAEEMLAPFFEVQKPTVITIGTSNQIRISTNYKIDDNSDGVDAEITQKIYDGLKSLAPAGTTYEQFTADNVLSSQKVGPSIADDIKKGAYWAVFFALIGIALYIFFRFKDMSYSIGTVAALAWDTVFILGLYSILWGFLPFSMEVDQTFIGAVLTAIGYSVNDKVVIFDRVREFTHLYPKRSKKELFNEALNSTLDRTFNTGMSVLFVLFVIFIFAGEAVRSFSFVMILGMIIGTFSSLFLAAPLAYEMQAKKQNKQNKAEKN